MRPKRGRLRRNPMILRREDYEIWVDENRLRGKAVIYEEVHRNLRSGGNVHRSDGDESLSHVGDDPSQLANSRPTGEEPNPSPSRGIVMDPRQSCQWWLAFRAWWLRPDYVPFRGRWQ